MADLPRGTRLQIEPHYLALLAGPTCVFLGTIFFLANYGDVDLVFPGIEPVADAGVQELIGRYKFYAALFFYGAVSIAVAIYFAVDVTSRHTRRSLLWVGAGVGFIVLLALGFSVIVPREVEGLANWELLGRNVFEATVAQGHVTRCADGGTPPDCRPKDAFAAMIELLGVIDFLAALGASGAILGTILTLARPVERHDLSTETGRALTVRELHGAREASKRYLYCSGLMLSSGMMVLLAWMHWPAPVIADAAVRKTYTDLVGAVSLVIGVSYSLLILSYYMPVTLTLARRIYRVEHDMRPAGSADTAAPAAAVPALPQVGQLEGLKVMIAIISPILASAVGSFGNAILFE